MVIRRCKHASALGIFLAVFLAILGFTYLSNVLASRVYENPASIWGLDIVGLDLYFLVAFFSGMGLAGGMHQQVFRHRSLVMGLMTVPGVVVLFTLSYVFVIPLARGFLAVMPLVGLSLAIKSFAEWHFSGVVPENLSRLRRLVKAQIVLCLAIPALFELGVLHQRLLAAVVIYPSLVLLGILLVVEARWVREDVEAAMRACAARVAGHIAPFKDVETEVRTKAPHAGTGMPGQARAIMAFFILAMVPCIALLAHPARLDIVYATAGGEERGLIIVNRGGQAAEDVELWGDEELIIKIGRIEGFGVWEDMSFRFPAGYLYIKVGGRIVASGTVYYPPTACNVIWFAIAIIAIGTVMPAILRAGKR